MLLAGDALRVDPLHLTITGATSPQKYFYPQCSICRHGTNASNGGAAAKESCQIPTSAILRPSVPRHLSAR